MTATATLAIEQIEIGRLIPYARNAKLHNDRQVSAIAGSIKEFGFNNPVLIDSSDGIIAGHGRVLGAKKLGLTHVPCIRLSHLTDAQRRAYILADNRLGDIGGGYDIEMLMAEVEALKLDDINMDIVGFTDEELQDLGVVEEKKKNRHVDAEPREDAAEALVAEWKVEKGQIWSLGKHRLTCGDSTDKETLRLLLDGAKIDLFLTDPPYCSGGFQEAGKSSGSIGSKRIGEDGKEYSPRILNDSLSSRGYCALMKSVLSVWEPSFAYMFLDWRMWVQLFDVMESSGFSVRNMIVWNKQSPGMGCGWRSQHELIMFGARAKQEFDGHKAKGNVLSEVRTGNPLHPTQKPVKILEDILDVTDFCQTIGDPFSGSGSTILACESMGRTCYASEMDAGFVAVTLQRYLDATGNRPVRIL